MIWILRNIGVRLWITTLFFIPLGFYLMPWITTLFPDINPAWILLAMMAGFIPVLGLLLDMAGKNAVTSLIKEGQAWERAGINTKAEKKYNRALRLYDTFLFGLFSARRTTRKILAALARFKLNTSVGNENFNLAAAMYLKMNPGDEAMAERWLQQAQKSRRLNTLDQEILTLLAETYYSHKALSALLADIFQKSGRRDYAAKNFIPRSRGPLHLQRLTRRPSAPRLPSRAKPFKSKSPIPRPR
nr:hypothetical protein [Desulfobacula sp.]